MDVVLLVYHNIVTFCRNFKNGLYYFAISISFPHFHHGPYIKIAVSEQGFVTGFDFSGQHILDAERAVHLGQINHLLAEGLNEVNNMVAVIKQIHREAGMKLIERMFKWNR